DVLYFHANTLHRSDQNKSQLPRWSMICSYNAARNDPYKESHHPRYTPLVKVPDSAIREYGTRRFQGGEGDEIWLPADGDPPPGTLAKGGRGAPPSPPRDPPAGDGASRRAWGRRLRPRRRGS